MCDVCYFLGLGAGRLQIPKDRKIERARMLMIVFVFLLQNLNLALGYDEYAGIPEA
jgi:hypothetical protein